VHEDPSRPVRKGWWHAEILGRIGRQRGQTPRCHVAHKARVGARGLTPANALFGFPPCNPSVDVTLYGRRHPLGRETPKPP
jgi:hypothetical protein